MVTPLGLIDMFSGPVVDIPPGWGLCNGTLGTPDLRGRFIQGWGAEAIGTTGGVDAVPTSHDHDISSITIPDPFGHRHSFNGPLAAAGTGGGSPAFTVPQLLSVSAPTHTHTFGAGDSDSVSHTHTPSGVTEISALVRDNRPAYYALAFIMKLSRACFDEVVIDVIQSSDDADDLNGIADNLVTLVAANGSVGGFRFQNVAIPQGATIQRAYMTERNTGGLTGLSITAWGEASNNAATFTPADLPGGRPKTAASVAHNAWPDYPEGIDLTTIVQEIVNRPGWVSGNALVILLENNDPTDDTYITAWDLYNAFPGTANLMTARLVVQF